MNSFSIGWDVGAWHCDKNSKSKDAVVILDQNANPVGSPSRRTNLTHLIRRSDSSEAFIQELFQICKAPFPSQPLSSVLAIDAPLGFPKSFTQLINGSREDGPIDGQPSGENPYLYRQTERLLFQAGKPPLSAILHQIGSQATKVIHALRKFGFVLEECGVWRKGNLRIIETYPAPCLKENQINQVKAWLDEQTWILSNTSNDQRDAAVCAYVAHLFATSRPELREPLDDIPPEEGWIWVPRSVYAKAN